MLPWEKRPVEIANLLNASFCSILLKDSIAGFNQENTQGMPYALSFIILPLVLHKPTRECLPRIITTQFHAWLERNQEVRIGFAGRARQLVPYTKEAIVFGMEAGIITIAGNGRLALGKKSLINNSWNSETEAANCRKKALFVGRWLARGGKVSTIFILWGICP